MTPAIARRRLALFALFFIPGITLASWVTRTPAIRDLLEASTAEMGLVLFGLSVGSMIGILASGALVMRFGAKPVIIAGASLITISMPIVGMGGALSVSTLTAFGLFCFGLGVGGGEVALNIEGGDVEQRIGRSVLPAMHGCFSLGTFVGAVIGIVFTAMDFPVVIHLVAVGVVAAAIAATAIPQLQPGVGRISAEERAVAATEQRPKVWRDRRLLLIGAVILAMALAEGAANDWLPLLMVDGHGFDPALGSAIFAVFAASMAVGRFVGGWFVERFGRPAVLGASAAFGAVGLAIVVFVDSQPIVAAAVVLWGLGASLGFPVAISAAAASGPDSTARVSLVTTVGYIAFLVGPPLLGFIGDEAGLRGAMIVPLALMAVVIAAVPALRSAQPRSADAEREPAQPS
jgi:fucose permease